MDTQEQDTQESQKPTTRSPLSMYEAGFDGELPEDSTAVVGGALDEAEQKHAREAEEKAQREADEQARNEQAEAEAKEKATTKGASVLSPYGTYSTPVDEWTDEQAAHWTSAYGMWADDRDERWKAKPEGGGQSLEEIFAEQPVPLHEFITSPEYLGNPPLSAEQYEAVRHLEQIFLPETYEALAAWDRYWTPTRVINFAYLQWGKGSGKDHVCRIAIVRCVYLLLCLRSPTEYFGLAPQDEIHTLNVAASASQAYRAFFKPLKTLVAASPWFKDKFHPKEYSVAFGRVGHPKQIEAVSGHSFMESLEGLNIIVGLADEISAFKTKEEAERYARSAGGREPARTSDAILKMIRTSARTRFPRNFKIAAISYPRFKDDAIQTLCKRGRADNAKYKEDSRIYVSGPKATWEVNPRVSGKEEFREDYEEDPVMARAMYECLPELGMNIFFRDESMIYQAFDGTKTPITIDYFLGIEEAAEHEYAAADITSWQAKFNIDAKVCYPVKGCLYSLHADLALTGDSAGVAMAHVKNWTADEHKRTFEDTEVVAQRPLVKLDFVTSFDADMAAKPPREIQIRWFRKLIIELKKRGFEIGIVSLDNFQSADTLQILNAQGIEAVKRSTDRTMEPWETLRDVMYDGRLEAYDDELTIDELKHLGTRITGSGTKVDHPPTSSKDRADAVAGAIMGAIEVGGRQGETEERADAAGAGPLDLEIRAGVASEDLSLADIGMGHEMLRWEGEGRGPMH